MLLHGFKPAREILSSLVDIELINLRRRIPYYIIIKAWSFLFNTLNNMIIQKHVRGL